MKFYVIAGEASGDLHGANLIRELKKQQPDSEFRAWGGDMMEEQGAQLVKHYRDLAFMGFSEVLLNLKTILGNIKFCKADIEEWNPDAVIMIDYPGFNLRIAEHVKSLEIPVLYYISPQVWAWKKSRVHKIKKVVDKMYVILPFEQAFYEEYDYKVEFVGHPLLDVIEWKEPSEEASLNFCRENSLNEKPIIALLPGSRKQEIKRMLPIMLNVNKHFPEYQFVIAGAPSQDAEFYHTWSAKHSDVHLLFGKTYDLFKYAKAGLVTSGTATLEAALFGLPEVVCYKGSPVSYAIARMLVKIKFISLVNLIMDREVVKELIQSDLTVKKIRKELNLLLNDESRKSQIEADYAALREKLGGSGASEKTASLMLKTLKG
ncbi:lipid-A-disaccharide synthase [Halocola ammonii]